MLIAAGQSGRAVASAVKVSEQTICNWKLSPLFERAVAGYGTAIAESDLQDLLRLRRRALERLAELMEDEAPGVALRAAQLALSRTDDLL